MRIPLRYWIFNSYCLTPISFVPWTPSDCGSALLWPWFSPLSEAYIGWFQPKSRRRIAIRRIAERLSWED
jgi:hypothetical protein